MPTTEQGRTREETARLAEDTYNLKVRPLLRPEDDGKYVALNVITGDYEIDEDDYAAVMRLRARCPAADAWLMQAGYPTSCRIRSSR